MPKVFPVYCNCGRVASRCHDYADFGFDSQQRPGRTYAQAKLCRFKIQAIWQTTAPSLEGRARTPYRTAVALPACLRMARLNHLLISLSYIAERRKDPAGMELAAIS